MKYVSFWFNKDLNPFFSLFFAEREGLFAPATRVLIRS